MVRRGGQLTLLLLVLLLSAGCPAMVPGRPLGPRAEKASPSPIPGVAAGRVAPAEEVAFPTATAAPTAAPTATPRPTAPPTSTPVQRPRTIQPRGREVTAELPRRLSIPAIGVDAELEFVGLTPEGAMGVPRDPARVAWYQLGPRPGDPGNAILAGHVDWGGKTAVFWELRDLAPGDTVEVTAADGRKYSFQVQWAHWFETDSAPVKEVFRQSDEVEITLITCGGVFDAATRQYLSRLVVRAGLR